MIAVQIENELDFYSCADPVDYIAALRDLALAQGITVPLVVCAGQGDIAGAGGEVPGLLPTGNFYPNDRDPSIEELVAQYEAMLRARGLPLCVTETNRAHQTLRRLLSAARNGSACICRSPAPILASPTQSTTGARRWPSWPATMILAA